MADILYSDHDQDSLIMASPYATAHAPSKPPSAGVERLASNATTTTA